jgi:hypothetical protein
MKCDKCGYSDNGSGDWAHICGPVNIKAGADIHAGDGGYSIGTEKGYEHICKQRSVALVIGLVGSDLADDWWNSPNKAFNGRTPAGMWLEDFRQVHNYLMHHAFVGGGS